MKRSEMSELLISFFLPYQNTTVSEPVIGLWSELFKDESKDRVWAAMAQALKNNSSGFPPSPGEVNKFLLALNAPPVEIAETVWSKVLGFAAMSMPEEKALGEAAKLHPQAPQIIRSIGYDRIRYADIETELAFVRREFLRGMFNIQQHQAQITTHEDAKKALGMIQAKLATTLVKSIT